MVHGTLRKETTDPKPSIKYNYKHWYLFEATVYIIPRDTSFFV